MKKFFMSLAVILMVSALLTGLGAGNAYAALNIVTSTTDLASIASYIGKDKVNVTSISKGYQDPHFVEPKPSYMLLLKKADLYFVVGMSLETAWSPSLEQGSRNAAIMKGGASYVDCSIGIIPLEKPASVDKSLGDVHPGGNPHYHLDPENGRIIAKNIARALIKKDPENRAFYEKNLELFNKELTAREIKWLKAMKPFKGMKVVSDHKMWSYFVRRFGIDVISTIEPKPGITPSPAYTAKLIQNMKAQNVTLIIRTPYFDKKVTDMVARNSGARMLTLPSSVGGTDGATDYFKLFEYIISQLSAQNK